MKRNTAGRIHSLVLALAALALPAAGGTAAQDVCDGVAPVGNTTLRAVTVVSGLADRPLLVTAPPGDFGRLFVVEQNGYVRVWHAGSAPGTWGTFLNISSKITTSNNEQGLLGLAFDPDYANNGYFYVNYSQVTSGATIIARYSVSGGDPDVADATSESILLRFTQPQGNHNGGHIEFGPDGYLYISTGDGGGANDLHGLCGNSQNTTNLLGKILRIDPSASATGAPDCNAGCVVGPSNVCTPGAYSVPSDNALSDGAGGDCDEIWSWGLRNPWRFAFDRANGDVYIADVGQNCWEEINYVSGETAGGENYGWRQMEGNVCFNTSDAFDCFAAAPQACGGSPPCNDPSLTDPVLAYDHGNGRCSVTGGYVYRGCLMPEFQGKYFYGDYCEGSVRSFEIAGGAVTNAQNWTSQVAPTNQFQFGLTSFGLDARGELYVIDRSPGSVVKLLPPFNQMRVSGVGAGQPFMPSRDGDWTWEDLQFETMHPVSFYRVYRGTPGDTFECIHASTGPSWAAGGDGTTPLPGELLAYVVTAVNPAGVESSSGEPPRTLVNPCPAP